MPLSPETGLLIGERLAGEEIFHFITFRKMELLY
jgi:hypothetical protein